MDYIREELLRHRNALTQLMLGMNPGRPEQRQEAAEEVTEAEETAALQAEEALFRAGRRLAAGGNTQKRWEASEAELWEAEDAFVGGYLPAEYPAVWFLTDGRERADQRRPRVSAEGGAEAGIQILSAAGEERGAVALSRVFQRDARRYDGGFTLY